MFRFVVVAIIGAESEQPGFREPEDSLNGSYKSSSMMPS